jgi:DoxX
VSPVPVWAGPYLAAGMLLVAAGLAKVRRPADTSIALRRAGLPVPEWAVRAGAAAEVAAGCWAFTSGRAAAGLVALSYLGFAGFVALALRRGSPVSSCGCFGRPDSPPTVSHIVLNLAAAATAAWMAFHAHPDAVSVLRHQPLTGVPLLLLMGAVAYLAYLVMAVMPKTLAAGSAP